MVYSFVLCQLKSLFLAMSGEQSDHKSIVLCKSLNEKRAERGVFYLRGNEVITTLSYIC